MSRGGGEGGACRYDFCCHPLKVKKKQDVVFVFLRGHMCVHAFLFFSYNQTQAETLSSLVLCCVCCCSFKSGAYLHDKHNVTPAAHFVNLT